MNCGKCGAMIVGDDQFCQMCGNPLKKEEYAPSAPVSNGSSGNGFLILIGILIILAVVLLPMFNRGLIGAEMLPNDRSIYFNEAMEMLIDDGDAIKKYVVIFCLAGIVGGVMFLLGALAGGRGFCATAAFICGGIMLLFLGVLISQEGADSVFSFDDTNIGIGFWVTLILFVIGFFRACSSKK